MKVQINNYAENSYTNDEVNGVFIYHEKGVSFDEKRDQRVIDCGKALAAQHNGELVDVAIYNNGNVCFEVQYEIKEDYEVIFPDVWTKVGKVGYKNGALYVNYDVEERNVLFLQEYLED